MARADTGSLDDDAEDEDGAGDQDTILAREDLGKEARQQRAQPGTQFQNGRQPTPLGLVGRVFAHICPAIS